MGHLDRRWRNSNVPSERDLCNRHPILLGALTIHTHQILEASGISPKTQFDFLKGCLEMESFRRMGGLTVQIDSEVSKGWCGLTQAALADAVHMSSPDRSESE